MKNRVLVAMSGGVDSSVAALLLKAEGYDVAGVTMCLGVKDNREGRAACCGPNAIEDARRVCQKLKISHHVFDYSEELEKYVIDRFISDYMQGRTPNPCITGLGVTHGFPLYVISIDAAKNLIVVGPKSSLNSKQLVARELNLLTPQLPGRASAQIRYGSNSSTCTLSLEGTQRLNILFDNPISAVTPGQSVVCYSKDRVLCGGIIEKDSQTSVS